jgi:hypothetical protein
MADERPHGRGDGGSPMRGRRELLSELEAAFVQPSGADVRSAAPPRPSPPPQVHARSSAGRSGARSLHLTHPKLSLPSVPASLILSARCFALCRLPRLGRSPFPTASSVLASFFCWRSCSLNSNPSPRVARSQAVCRMVVRAASDPERSTRSP